MILILGDSNYRNTMETYGESLSMAVGEEVLFEFVSSVESLRLALTGRKDEPSIVVAGSPLNEIASIVNKNQKKGRDETVKMVIEDMVKAMVASAVANPTCAHIVMPPFARQDPKWIEEKVKLAYFYTKDGISEAKKRAYNLAVGSIVDITIDDLGEDKLHLNDLGKEKLYGIIEADLSKCKESTTDTQEGMELNHDWASQMGNEVEPPTPASIRKRVRNVEESDSDSGSDGKKKARLDSSKDVQ